MPPAGKCRRTCAPPVPDQLPVCLLLEIAARTVDAPTIFRCAATCKLLRREILSADFLRRVCQGPDAVVPSRTLGVLANTFSVLHPVTAASVTLERYLAPFMSRSGSVAAAGLLEQYEPLMSRNGLVVLCQRRRLGSAADDLCVYDPMTNSRAFLPSAPDIGWDPYRGLGDVHLIDQCALLTAADGIGCSFMLVAVDMARNLDCASLSARVRVQTVSSSSLSDAGAGWGWIWGPVKSSDRHPCPRWCTNLDRHNDAAVVVGGVVHWLIHCGISSSASLQHAAAVGEYILTYDVNTAAVGSVDVPKDRRRRPDLLRDPLLQSSRLASSSSSPADGKLSFVVAAHLEVFVWVLSEGGSWERHVQIDMMEVWGSMLLPWTDPRLELETFFGDCWSPAVFLRFADFRFVLDMETGVTTCLGGKTKVTGISYEVDLASRLASMKSF